MLPPLADEVQADLDLALRLATAASRLAMRRFEQGRLFVTAKDDGSPVSDADMAVERRIRSMLETERPGDAMIGEEFGESGSSRRRWIVDPIDGTANYVSADPNWAVLIALEIDGDPVVGVADAPALGRRWWSGRGLGAWSDSQRLQARPVPFHESRLSARGHRDLERLPQHHPLRRTLGKLPAATRELFWAELSVVQDDCDVDIDICLAAQPWDLAARKAIVVEAGGRFSDAAGSSRIDSGTSLTAHPAVHEQILDSLRRRERGRSDIRALG